MRIALVTDWYAPRVGGIEVHVQGLGARLAARGHEVTVLTPWPGPPLVDGVAVERLPLRPFPGLGVSLSPRGLARVLTRALAPGRWDVVHGHVSFGSTAAIAAGWAARRSGIPSLGTFHSVFGPGLGGVFVVAAPLLRWRRWPFRATAVSEAVASDLRWIMPERPVEILPCAIEPAAWACPPRPPDPRRLRLVTVARLHPRKRVDALVRAAAGVASRMRARGVEVTLDVVGDGPRRSRLEALARTLGGGDAVRFSGHAGPDDVRAALARADLFVNACTLESFGIAGLEALAAGLPVVARAGTGAASYVSHGTNGLLVDSDEELAAALERLASAPERMEALRAGAARGIPERFTWERLVDRHEELYRELAPGGR